VEAGVVNVAVAVWHEHQDIRKTHVPQNLVRGIDVTSVECLGNGLVDPSVTIIVASAAARVSAVTP